MMKNTVIVFVCVLLIGNQAAADKPNARETELLKAHGIQPDVNSIRTFLRSCLPGGEIHRRQKTLIAELGAPSFARRQAATRALMRLVIGSTASLREAAKHNDPEIRSRARKLLAAADDRGEALLLAVFRTVHRVHLRGLGTEILATLPHCGSNMLKHAAERALQSTVGTADAEMLRHRTRGSNRVVRIAAIRSLESVLGSLADPDLLQLTRDDDERVQVEAARALANHGNRASLSVLGRLLDSADLDVRISSVKTLRAFTGKSFAFTPYEPAMVRVTARDRWRKWIATHTASAELHFPLKDVRIERGRTLFCDYSKHRLVEIDDSGTIVWETNVGKHPWGVQGLPNGHRLVAAYSAKSVTEYDNKGKIVWTHTGLPGGPTSVRRLPNGNTLLACTDSQTVVEVSREGKTVMTVSINGRPTDAQRLDNGRTLIVLQNAKRVVEVDRKGRVVWEIAQLSNPFSARRLENGNTLVSCLGNGSVREYDRRGKEVWSKSGFQYPYDVQRLANGNTLVSDQKGLTEVTPQGTVVKRHSFANVSKFFRY